MKQNLPVMSQYQDNFEDDEVYDCMTNQFLQDEIPYNPSEYVIEEQKNNQNNEMKEGNDEKYQQLQIALIENQMEEEDDEEEKDHSYKIREFEEEIYDKFEGISSIKQGPPDSQNTENVIQRKRGRKKKCIELKNEDEFLNNQDDLNQLVDFEEYQKKTHKSISKYGNKRGRRKADEKDHNIPLDDKDLMKTLKEMLEKYGYQPGLEERDLTMKDENKSLSKANEENQEKEEEKQNSIFNEIQNIIIENVRLSQNEQPESEQIPFEKDQNPKEDNVSLPEPVQEIQPDSNKEEINIELFEEPIIRGNPPFNERRQSRSYTLLEDLRIIQVMSEKENSINGYSSNYWKHIVTLGKILRPHESLRDRYKRFLKYLTKDNLLKIFKRIQKHNSIEGFLNFAKFQNNFKIFSHISQEDPFSSKKQKFSGRPKKSAKELWDESSEEDGLKEEIDDEIKREYQKSHCKNKNGRSNQEQGNIQEPSSNNKEEILEDESTSIKPKAKDTNTPSLESHLKEQSSQNQEKYSFSNQNGKEITNENKNGAQKPQRKGRKKKDKLLNNYQLKEQDDVIKDETSESIIIKIEEIKQKVFINIDEEVVEINSSGLSDEEEIQKDPIFLKYRKQCMERYQEDTKQQKRLSKLYQSLRILDESQFMSEIKKEEEQSSNQIEAKQEAENDTINYIEVKQENVENQQQDFEIKEDSIDQKESYSEQINDSAMETMNKEKNQMIEISSNNKVIEESDIELKLEESTETSQIYQLRDQEIHGDLDISLKIEENSSDSLSPDLEIYQNESKQDSIQNEDYFFYEELNKSVDDSISIKEENEEVEEENNQENALLQHQLSSEQQTPEQSMEHYFVE